MKDLNEFVNEESLNLFEDGLLDSGNDNQNNNATANLQKTISNIEGSLIKNYPALANSGKDAQILNGKIATFFGANGDNSKMGGDLPAVAKAIGTDQNNMTQFVNFMYSALNFMATTKITDPANVGKFISDFINLQGAQQNTTNNQ